MNDTQLTNILIGEGLIKSLNQNKMAGILERYTTNTGNMQVTVRKDVDIIINFSYTVTTGQYKQLLQLINACGWFVCSIHPVSRFQWMKYDEQHALKLLEIHGLRAISIEAKYDSDTSTDMLSRGYLYHVSPTKYEDRILKIGLIPKSKNKIATHPERIYLTKTEEDAEFLADKFTELDNTKTYNIYQIDLHALLKHNKNVKFYKDSAFTDKGIYTTVNIPPNCIHLVKKAHSVDEHKKT